mmetsp:Transcript_381/g.1310  ORF Transcript_381/g.1310 Transcript_381/m.1310 type:complete len:225 (+) Transcript_381:70-744(+)
MGCSTSSSVRGFSAPSMETVPEVKFVGKRNSKSRDVESQIVTVKITKLEGVPLAMVFRLRGENIVITSLGKNGSMHMWNQQHPDQEVLPGDIILSVNGISGEFWDVAAEIWKVGEMTIEVQKAQYPGANLRRSSSRVYLESETSKGTPLHGPVDGFKHICAEERCDVAECAICLEEFEAQDRMVQLPCKHVFHPLCAARWLARGRGECPLCRCSSGRCLKTTSI